MHKRIIRKFLIFNSNVHIQLRYYKHNIPIKRSMNQISINPLPPSPSLQLLLTLTVNLKREDNNCNRHGNTGFQLYPACRQLKFNQPAAPSATAPEKLERLVTAAIRGRYSHGPNDGGTPIHVSGHRTVLTDQTVDKERTFPVKTTRRSILVGNVHTV